MFSETRRSLHKSDHSLRSHQHVSLIDEGQDTDLIPILPSLHNQHNKPKSQYTIEVHLQKDDVKLTKKPTIPLSNMDYRIPKGKGPGTNTITGPTLYSPAYIPDEIHISGNRSSTKRISKGGKYDKIHTPATKYPTHSSFHDSVGASHHVADVELKPAISSHQMNTSIIYKDVLIPKLSTYNTTRTPKHSQSHVRDLIPQSPRDGNNLSFNGSYNRKANEHSEIRNNGHLPHSLLSAGWGKKIVGNQFKYSNIDRSTRRTTKGPEDNLLHYSYKINDHNPNHKQQQQSNAFVHNLHGPYDRGDQQKHRMLQRPRTLPGQKLIIDQREALLSHTLTEPDKFVYLESGRALQPSHHVTEPNKFVDHKRGRAVLPSNMLTEPSKFVDHTRGRDFLPSTQSFNLKDHQLSSHSSAPIQSFNLKDQQLSSHSSAPIQSFNLKDHQLSSHSSVPTQSHNLKNHQLSSHSSVPTKHLTTKKQRPSHHKNYS